MFLRDTSTLEIKRSQSSVGVELTSDRPGGLGAQGVVWHLAMVRAPAHQVLELLHSEWLSHIAIPSLKEWLLSNFAVRIYSDFLLQDSTDHVLSICYSSRYSPGSFPEWAYLILTGRLNCGYYWLCFTDEETELQRNGSYTEEYLGSCPPFGSLLSLSNIKHRLLEWEVENPCSKSFYKSPPPGPLFSFLKHVDVYNL